MTKELAFSKFGIEWSKLLAPFLLYEIDKIALAIQADRDKGLNVIPPKGSDKMFRIFKDLQPDKISVILLGQDVYHSLNEVNEPVMDGYAFSSDSLQPQPSLANIIKEIYSCYPSKEQDEFIPLDRCDLGYLVKQGVFLVNTALSVVQGKPGSHTDLWKDFTKCWIEFFTRRYKDVIWLVFGTKALELTQYIFPHNNHKLIITSHPSPFSFKSTMQGYPAFSGSNCFRKCNEELVKLGKKEISW